MKSFIGSIIATCLALYLATLLVPNVWIAGDTLEFIKILLLAGIVLGLVNYFVKPVIKIVTFPLRFLTLGLIGLVINIAIIEGVDILFPKLHIRGFWALFLTSILIWATSLLVPKKRAKDEA